MHLTSYGTKQIVIGAVVFIVLAALCVMLYRNGGRWGYLVPLIPLVVAFCWMLAFFRDPDRVVPTTPGLIVSPADGTITHVDTADEPEYIEGSAQRLSIFLSIFNVHLNRAPADGTVEFVKFRPGEFFDARREESLVKNQNQDIGIKTSEPGMPAKMVVRQSTGAIARTIVCPVRPGDALARGDRYGMIKFGSRTTLFLSDDVEVEWLVSVGDAVKAGETVVARVKTPQ